MTGTWKTKGVSAKRLRYGRISSNLPLLPLSLLLAFLLPHSLLLSLSFCLFDLSSHCFLSLSLAVSSTLFSFLLVTAFTLPLQMC